MDLASLTIDRLVVHEIPKKEPKASADHQEPLGLSEALSPLPDALRSYVMLRLRRSLQSADRAFDVVFDDGSVSETPADVRQLLLDLTDPSVADDDRDKQVVDLSRRLAERLFGLQPPQPPTGLLAVCTGSLGNGRPLLAVMKLEHEQGVTVEQHQVDGRTTFEMVVEDSLVLVEGTKVFKAAAFAPTAGANPHGSPDDFSCDARLSDSQNPFTASGVAAYFASGLLGVKLAEEPRVVTEKVFKAVERFINESIADPARQVAAERALVVEMTSNKQTFSAQVYGNQHLQTQERKALRDYLKEADLPATAFPKDLSLVEGRLKLISLELEGKITVVAPEERFEDETIVLDTGDGTEDAVVTIRSALRRTATRGR